MSQPLTKRQKQLLDFIGRFSARCGYPPTHEEMSEAISVSSVATVHDHLLELSKKGFIKIYKGAVRGVEILRNAAPILPANKNNYLEIPIVGVIAAGRPIEAIENKTAFLKVSPQFVSGNRRSFVLKVRGESMVEEGILDGDYVVIEEQNTAENGDIVVALIDDNLATLKKFYREKGRIKLAPANAKMQPIYAKNVTIQGKVKGIIRKY